MYRWKYPYFIYLLGVSSHVWELAYISSLQELLGSTIHEQDDGDEFILLGLHQMTVPSHCVHAMRAAVPLLASHRSGLQSASLRLMSTCITLLRDCVHPSMLWRLLGDGEPCEEESGKELLVTEVIRGLQMVGGFKLYGFVFSLFGTVSSRPFFFNFCFCIWAIFFTVKINK